MNQNIKVSICVVTYNQEKYIRECLQSLVEQKTDFDFEIIVGDDCSTDGTRIVIKEFVNKYPGLFQTIYQETNVGPAFNYKDVHSLARGKYVAHIDGDDITLPGKLKKQHDILEANLDCVLVSHDMRVLVGDEFISRTIKRHKEGVNSIHDLYQTLPFFANSSKMVRANIDKQSLHLINKNTFDIELHVMMAKHGNIYHVDEPFGIYRSGVGVSSLPMNMVNKEMVNAVVRVYESAINDGYNSKEIKRAYSEYIFSCAYRSAIAGYISDLKKYIKMSISIDVVSIPQVVFYILSYSPSFLIALCKLRMMFRYKS